MNQIKYIFVIDTKDYAGNFERNLCAYVTGITGDCEVGSDYADLFSQEIDTDKEDLFEEIELRSEHDGCARPCAIFKSPNSTKYNSVAIFFYKKPNKDLILLMKERAKKYNDHLLSEFDSSITITGFRLIKEETILTEESV